jgi:glycosyltransferase involved in cell wall biosynthesis
LKINFVGAFKDSSGYAQFARNWAYAMSKANWDINLELISFEQTHAPHGVVGKVCDRLLERKYSGCDINIINMIPKVYESFRKPNCMNIGYTMFEATKIPKVWVDQCNQMDAILVPCEWNKQVFSESGVTVPIGVATPGIDESLYPIKKSFDGHKKNFKFYSIFQWSERKNPAALIKAFISAFEGNDDVCLTLKTHMGLYSKDEADLLMINIKSIRDSMTVKKYPKILLKHERLSEQLMLEMHLQNDCFVLPTRAEGFGFPYIESMMIGNPTMGTNYSGNLEFMNKENSYLIDYQLEPVSNMRNLGHWYTGDMRWASANVAQLADTMKEVYDNQDSAREKGLSARKNIMSHMSWNLKLDSLKNTLVEMYNSWKR